MLIDRLKLQWDMRASLLKSRGAMGGELMARGLRHCTFLKRIYGVQYGKLNTSNSYVFNLCEWV